MRQTSTSAAMLRVRLALASAALALVAAIAWFLPVQKVRAEPELSLSWSTKDALATCPDLAWAMARIASELGRAPIADVSQGVRAIVEIEKGGSGFALRLRTEVGDARGERAIEGADCRQLGEAAILIVALSVAEASEERARNVTTQPSGAASASDTSDAPETARTSKHRAASVLGFALRPELVVELGLLRLPTLGPGLALSLERRPYRVELAGFWLGYGSMRAAGQEIELRLGAARVSGCALWGAERVRGGPCLGVELGAVRGRNAQSGLENHTLWGAGVLAARLMVALWTRLSLVLDADLVASWGRLRFLRTIEDERGARRETLYESGPVQLRTHLGLEIGF